MTPLALEITDLLGIRRASLAFSPGVTAIVGPNGAGKSSILDALIVALFGSPGDTRAVAQADLVRLPASEGSVLFSFECAAGTMRVFRSFRRGRRAQEALLERKEQGRWTAVASGARDVWIALGRAINPWPGDVQEKRLASLRDAFLASVLVPQGSVTALLDATPAERWRILSAVLGMADEDAFREGARAVAALAVQDETALRGALAAVSEDMKTLPEDVALEEEIAALSSSEELVRRALDGVERALRARRMLDDLQGRRARAAVLLEEAERAERRFRDRERLGRACEGLRNLRAAAAAYGSNRRELGAAAEKRRTREAVLARMHERLSALRTSYRQLLARVEKLAAEAKHLPLVRDADTLRKDIARLEEEVTAQRTRSAEFAAKIAVTEKRLRNARATRLSVELAALRKEHVATARILARKTERLYTAMAGWLTTLAGDDGCICIATLSAARVVILARTLRDAGVQKALMDWSQEHARCLELLRRGRAAREALSTLGAVEVGPAVDAAEDVPELERVLRAVEGAFERTEGMLAASRAEKGRREDALLGVSALFPEKDDAFPDRVRRAAAEHETLSRELERVRAEGEKLRISFDGERDALERSRLEEAREGARLDAARSALYGACAALQDARSRFRWSGEELRRALTDFFPPATEEERAAATGAREAARREVEAAREAYEAFAASLPGVPPEVRSLSEQLVLRRAELEALLARRATVEERRKRRKELAARAVTLERDLDRFLPAFDSAQRLARLVDGRNFVRFAADALLGETLAEVNGALPDLPWRLRAADGAVEVISRDGTRPAAGLSGGERSLASLLMLRALASRVGFQRMLFVDEGLAMLDDDNLELVVELLGELGARAFVGVITHDPAVADAFGRRWEVEGGTIVCR